MRKWRLTLEHESLISFRSTSPQETSLVFAAGIKDALDLLENPLKLDKQLEIAVSEYRLENSQQQRKKMDEYDLPKDKKIAHLRVFPQNYDVMIDNGLMDSMLLSST